MNQVHPTVPKQGFPHQAPLQPALKTLIDPLTTEISVRPDICRKKAFSDRKNFVQSQYLGKRQGQQATWGQLQLQQQDRNPR